MADDTPSPEELREMEAEAINLGFNPQVETRSVSSVDGVNFAERTITVLAVPYESPAIVPFRGLLYQEVFTRSAFNGIETRETNPQARRIPVTACLDLHAPDHRGGKLCGRASAFFPSREDGLVTALKISRTPIGDETLELANDGTLSPSVGFAVKNRLDEDINMRARTRRINRAFLDHIAFVAEPAYPGAKVLSVRGAGGSDIEPNGSTTPMMDELLNDPVLQWARNYPKS